MDRRIFKLKQQILSQPHVKFTVKQMAETTNVSPSYLSRLFKENLGISPKGFVRDVRLELAKTLLETSFKRVKEICYEVGFSDQRNFARDFKKKYTHSPTEYQKQYWAKLEEMETKYTKS